MGKVKEASSKSAKAADPLTSVKKGGVSKASSTPVAKSKKLAKDVASKATNGKKSKKQVESDSESSESESSDSDAEEDSDSESSEEEKPAPKAAKVNAKAKKAEPAPESSDSSDSSEDEDSDSEEEEAPKAKKADAKTTKSDESSDDSDDSDSDSDSDESMADAAAPKAKKADAKAESSDDSDESEDSDSDDSEEEKKPEPSKKRKVEEEETATPAKKAKADDSEDVYTTLFVGNLGWGVDDNILYDAFKDCAGLNSARVVTDKQMQRSKGFGYVDFDTMENCKAALEAMQGFELEGRGLRLDPSKPRPAEGTTPNQRANDRAQRHGDTVSPESDTLFVGNLPFDADEDVISQFFGEVAEVKSLRLPTDPESGNRKGFGYVSFHSIDDAKSAFSAKNGAYLGEGRGARAIRLDYASQRPPREGGGGGGRGGFGGGRGGGGFGGRGGGGFGGRGGGRGGAGGRGGGRGGFGGRGGGFGGGRGGGGFQGKKISFD